MSRIRVLVVEDSVTVRKRIVEVLARRPDFDVAGEAWDGKEAIELCQSLRPDVVTMDMMMPVMSGLAAVEYIMAYCPTPILIVSSSTNRGELFKTYEALAAGALEVLEKPDGEGLDEAWEESLVSTLKLVSRIKVITHPRGRMGRPGKFREAIHPSPPSRRGDSKGEGYGLKRVIRAVAMGASTGGPVAVLEILKAMPPTFPLPILLVIHLGKTFAQAFAEWLDGESPLRVAYARDGESLRPGGGRVILAPPDTHMIVQGDRVRLINGPERHSCRPSVDALFESMAAELGPSGAACLLTGMGKDGAAGLLAVRRAGGVTLAQDEATSVVFGMPREAVLLGAAERILPLQEIASALALLAAKNGI